MAPSYIALGGGSSFWPVLAVVLPQILAQSTARKSAPKGPRALGLVQLAPSGKAHLIPITILYDGEFYDASAYKASPVPMALESGTVYEGVRAGVSQGLFTVSSALQGNNTWIGDGTWQSASAIAAAKAAAAKRRRPRRSLPQSRRRARQSSGVPTRSPCLRHPRRHLLRVLSLLRQRRLRRRHPHLPALRKTQTGLS